MKRLVLLLAVFFVSLASGDDQTSKEKPVHVKEYTRKDGTTVEEHYRAAPGTGHKDDGSTPPAKQETRKATSPKKK